MPQPLQLSMLCFMLRMCLLQCRSLCLQRGRSFVELTLAVCMRRSCRFCGLDSCLSFSKLCHLL